MQLVPGGAGRAHGHPQGRFGILAASCQRWKEGCKEVEAWVFFRKARGAVEGFPSPPPPRLPKVVLWLNYLQGSKDCAFVHYKSIEAFLKFDGFLDVYIKSIAQAYM